MEEKCMCFCFPYAGGSAYVYNEWNDGNIIGIEYNGHGSLFRKDFYETIQEAADDISDEIINKEINNYALFGHSLGAIIAIETAYKLSLKKATQPKKIIVSGSRPPHLLHKSERIAHLNKELFMKKVFEMGGMPEEIMNNEELFELSYELLCADISMLEQYNPSEDIIVNVPLLACYGEQDKDTNGMDMQEWSNYTSDKFELMSFEGNHFYIFNDEKIKDIVLGTIN